MTRSAFALTALLTAAAPATAADVIVTIKNVEVGKGTVSVGICDTGLGGEHCPVGGKQEPTAATLEFVFQNVPAGYYAFGGHQDLNQNGERDENFLGIPKEPVALSNNALDKMIPSFADAQVPVAEGAENRIEIELQMYGAKKTKSASRQ
jgi:outer membrane protein